MTSKTFVKLRNRGAAAVSVLTAFVVTSPVVAAPTQSAIKGNNQSVSATNQKAIFSDGGIFQKVTNALLFLVGAISVIMLIVGGIRYIVSAGDQNAVTGAKNTILYAIVGIIVAVIAWGVVNFVLTWLYTGDAPA